MSPGQILHGQMLQRQLDSVQDCPRNRLLKVGKIGSVTADIELSFCGWWGGVHSHFHVQPPTTLRLRCC